MTAVMTMPSQVDEHLTKFDRFATAAANLTGRAPFFAACVAMVVLWIPSYFIIQDLNLYQLVINTSTTIVTFLMVALLENSQARADKALQHKLNALARAMSDLMAENPELGHDRRELQAAVGLEERESSTD